MPRVVPAFLALLLTVNGWAAVPASSLETRGNSSYISQLAKHRPSLVRVRGSQWSRSERSQPSATLHHLPVLPARPAEVSLCRFVGFLSRPVDAPPAFFLGQRPPP